MRARWRSLHGRPHFSKEIDLATFRLRRGRGRGASGGLISHHIAMTVMTLAPCSKGMGTLVATRFVSHPTRQRQACRIKELNMKGLE